MKKILFLLCYGVLSFSSDVEVICVEHQKYIKVTDGNVTAILPKMVYHAPEQITVKNSSVGWRTEFIQAYSTIEYCQ